MIFCSNCGEKIEDDVKFCSKCGKAVGGVPIDNIKKSSGGIKNKKAFWWLIVPLIIILCLIFWPKITQVTQEISEIPKQERDTLFREIAPIVKVYSLGEKGPAGGIVFYDKGESSAGWRYLEVAPPETEFVNIQWGTYKWDIKGTHETIGSGEQNTRIIIRALEDKEINEHGKIAQLVNHLNYNGYTDWFLPSKDELYWMYQNLAQRGLGGFEQARYWSSTQYDASSAWYIHFGDNGRSSHSYDKRRSGAFFTTGELRARAIRAF
jgi:hypothetical protein